MAVALVDLGIIAALVGDAEVVLIKGSQAPAAELDEAISPGSKLHVAGSMSLLCDVFACPWGHAPVSQMQKIVIPAIMMTILVERLKRIMLPISHIHPNK